MVGYSHWLTPANVPKTDYNVTQEKSGAWGASSTDPLLLARKWLIRILFMAYIDHRSAYFIFH